MKRLLNIFVMLAIFIIANAQDPMKSVDVNQSLGYGEDRSYIYYNGTAADTIGDSDSTFIYTVHIKSKFNVTPSAYVSYDSLGGTAATVTTTLESKEYPSDPWTVRETVSWTAGSDTTMKIVSDSTHRDEFWRVKSVGATDAFHVKMEQLIINVIEER